MGQADSSAKMDNSKLILTSAKRGGSQATQLMAT